MKTSKTIQPNINIFWTDRLSLSALWCILKKGNIQQNIDIHFLEETYPGLVFFQCLRFLRIITGQVTKIEYSMGDMRLQNGESLQYESYRVALDTTITIVESIKTSEVYKKLASILPQDKVALYLEKWIYNEIFPLMRLLCIVRWHIRDGKVYYRHTIILSENGFFLELQRAWPDKTVSLVGYRQLFDLSWIRSCIKGLYNWVQDLFVSIMPKNLRPIPSKEPSIAVHYVEGIDLRRRSDLFWYPESQIDPKRVLIYFDRSYNHPITEEHIRQIESMGMRWISLSWRRGIPCGLKYVWRPPLQKESLQKSFKRTKVKDNKYLQGVDKWLFKVGVNLLVDIEYWQAFYRMFNVKIHHDAVEAGLQNVAQSIALDLVDGIRVGKQRSELFITISDMIGYYPDHVFFSWNCRVPMYLQGQRNQNDYCIISGFPYDAVFAKNRAEGSYIKEQLGNQGARFVIVLYDNMFGRDLYNSKTMIQSFYRNFLEWMLEDGEVGLIIKSKKPHVLDGLSEIHDLLIQAKTTGRCLQLGNVYGRLASDAAHGADIAVGIGGISSAVIEAVIAGCRGMVCELTGLSSHPFCRWGYGKVVFDDIDWVINSLKRYKENPDNEPELGDWSLSIDELDPFRDGKGGERIGTYIRWLLEGFDKGKSRNESIQYANKSYADKWGKDKVIELNEIKRCVATF